jgi:hypothetical protein
MPSVSKSAQSLVDHGKEHAVLIRKAETTGAFGGFLLAAGGHERLDRENLSLFRELPVWVGPGMLVGRGERLFAITPRERGASSLEEHALTRETTVAVTHTVLMVRVVAAGGAGGTGGRR